MDFMSIEKPTMGDDSQRNSQGVKATGFEGSEGMKEIRACIEKIGRRLIFATDYTLCDHSTKEARDVCFNRVKNEVIELPKSKKQRWAHRFKPGEYRLREGFTVFIEYKGEKEIAGLPTMLTGISRIWVLAPSPDIDFLLDL